MKDQKKITEKGEGEEEAVMTARKKVVERLTIELDKGVRKIERVRCSNNFGTLYCFTSFVRNNLKRAL